MKNTTRFLLLLVTLALFSAVGSARAQATFTKADNTTALGTEGSWTTPGVPGSQDVANWLGTYNTAGSLNAVLPASALSWKGITVGSLSGTAAGLVSLGGTGAAVIGSSLTLGTSGIDLSGANQNLVINAATIVLGGDQVWNTGTGRNLRLGVSGTGAANANVDGAGSITISGTGVVDANQGGGSGTADPAGYAGFSGKWIVNPGATLRGLRNGATAWGASTAPDTIQLKGGTLAPGGISGAVGNWTWSSPIALDTGTTSILDNQNVAGTGRTLTLNGVISGNGNLIFRNTSSVNDTAFNFILGTDNTYGGTTLIDGSLRALVVRSSLGTTAGTRTPLGTGEITVTNATLRNLAGSTPNPMTFANNFKLGNATLSSEDAVQAYTGNLTLTGTNTIQSFYNGKDTILNGTLQDGSAAGGVIFKPAQAGTTHANNSIYVNAHNTYTGSTTLGDGTGGKGIVFAKYADAFGSATSTLFSRGAQLQAGTAGMTIPNPIDSLGAGGVRVGGTNNFTLSGTITNNAQNRSIQNYGSATVTLGAIASSGSGSVKFEGGSFIVDGVISDAGGGLAIGGGLVSLNGASTYTGQTTVTNGRLVLNGSLISPITLSGTARISGTGSTTAALTNGAGTGIVLAGGATTTSLRANGAAFNGPTSISFDSPPQALTYDVVTYGAGGLTSFTNLSGSNYRGALTDDTANQRIVFAAGGLAARTWNTTDGTWDIASTTPWLEGDQKFYQGDTTIFPDPAIPSTVTLSGRLAPTSITVSPTFADLERKMRIS